MYVSLGPALITLALSVHGLRVRVLHISRSIESDFEAIRFSVSIAPATSASCLRRLSIRVPCTSRHNWYNWVNVSEDEMINKWNKHECATAFDALIDFGSEVELFKRM
jgi:hypothetical protein